MYTHMVLLRSLMELYQLSPSVREALLKDASKISKRLIQYKDSIFPVLKYHYGDKTILRPSYHHNEISFTGNTTVLH